jgi:hypothetical protein
MIQYIHEGPAIVVTDSVEHSLVEREPLGVGFDVIITVRAK